MNGRALAVLILVGLMAMSGLSTVGSHTRGDLGDIFNPFSVEDAEPWTDGLDDTSHTYIPPGGLIGTRLVDGRACLEAGASEGWIASSVITCPTDVRYDLVVIDADMPGDSKVEISVLDADAEATEVGYANATITNCKDIEGTVISIKPIDVATYPRLRIQVTLVASGTDRPTIAAWSVYFCPLDEWREDFVSDIRMDTVRGLNLTAGNLELDLTEKQGMTGRSGGTSASPFPTIVFDSYMTGGSDRLNAFYANFDKTGYADKIDISCSGTADVQLFDFNGDGFLDLLACNKWYNSGNPASQLYWGRSDGTWSQSDTNDFNVVRATDAAIGDFDGDGDADIAFSCYHSSSSTSSAIYLNPGNGDFDDQADITLTDIEYVVAEPGDFNNDGYDDVLYAVTGQVKVYYGGPSGPDTTPDLSWTISGYVYDVLVNDLDADGYDDVIILNNAGDSKVRIYMGSATGMDNMADHTITVGDSATFSASIGDLNNDGYTDIVSMGVESFNRYLYIFEGTATGWDDTNPHEISTGSNYAYAHDIVDINNDGLNDLVVGYGDKMRIYYGTQDAFPQTPDIIKSGLGSPYSVAIAQGGKTSSRKFAGRMVTQTINLPAGKQWDTLVLEGSTPANTSVTMTVLDTTNAPVPGLEDIGTTDADLSGLTSMSIKVEMWLESDLNTSTPTIDRLRVRWQDINTWREQFFGPSKAGRMMGTGITDGQLTAIPGASGHTDLLFASLRDGEGYNVRSTLHTSDGTIAFPTTGVSAVATADIDDNGYADIVFATRQTSDTNRKATSPLFMGSPVGWRSIPDHTFPTTGATDVLLEDLNGDGHMDVVFAQEYDGITYRFNSTLFWGAADGWSDRPDAEFMTTGASGVASGDLDGDGDLDLAFACYRSGSTATDSMVFYQGDEGFPSSPDERLPTMGARAVATGDLDADGATDLVFANSFSGGFAEIDSYIYWGKAEGGFETDPTALPTVGAQDVKAIDLDGDGDLDLAFANGMDNSQNGSVDSYVYLNHDGSFGSGPDARLPTMGASGVTAADLDGQGRMDLVFSSLEYAGEYQTASRVYMGGVSGWPSSPDAEIPTTGATDVVAASMVRGDTGGYLSKAITPRDPTDTGAFDTLRYTVSLEGSRQGTISVLDALTWEVLAERALEEGTHDWVLRDEFSFRDHTSVRVMVTFTGLDRPGDIDVDNLWLNWTKRVRSPPVAESITLGDATIYRTTETTVTVVVSDEYTPLNLLGLRLEHHLIGSEGWDDNLLTTPRFADGVWTATFKAPAKAVLGSYEFRANVTDDDGQWSGYLLSEDTLEVLNRLPTSPAIQMSPARPVTTSALRVEVTQGANDPENFPLTYHYRWFRDGVHLPELTGDVVPPSRTVRGENWTVEVCAFDGEDEGPVVSVSRIIQNAAPQAINPLPDPALDEDGEDTDWLDLSKAFDDPDGDTITWTVDPPPMHLTITIDPATGKVTIVPEADWNGEENITFVCSDGNLQASQTVTVSVHPINDSPRIVSLNDEPVEGDPVEYTIAQGSTLTIIPTVVDVEGHEMVFDVNTTAVVVDGITGVITFSPDNDAVGTLRFALSVHDVVSPTVKVKLNFIFHVVNENDPMEDPSISNPSDGDRVKANTTFYVTVVCYDPDTPFGQVLNYTWTSSIEGLLGHGNTLTLSLTEPGEHIITITVTDGEFQKTDSITIEVLAVDEPGPGPGPGPGEDPDDDPGDDGGPSMTGIMVALVIALVAAGAGGFVIVSRRKAEPEDEPEPAMDEREALQAIADMIGEAADVIEGSKNGDSGNGNGSGTGVDTWVETEEKNGIEVASADVAETQLSIETSVTQAAPAEIEALFVDIDTNGYSNGNGNGDEEAEQLRMDNIKRKYANTIGQLPYGIPSAALKDMDWNDLAAALATGEKKTVDDGREATMIDGKWYYSDMDDPSKFLKEHGAKPKPAPRAATATEDLLAKLEERFILGEITEETYRELRQKYNK